MTNTKTIRDTLFKASGYPWNVNTRTDTNQLLVSVRNSTTDSKLFVLGTSPTKILAAFQIEHLKPCGYCGFIQLETEKRCQYCERATKERSSVRTALLLHPNLLRFELDEKYIIVFNTKEEIEQIVGVDFSGQIVPLTSQKQKVIFEKD